MVDRLKEFCKKNNVDFGSLNFTIGNGYIKYKADKKNDKVIFSAFGVSPSSCTLSTDESDGMTVLTNNLLHLLSKSVRYVVFDDYYLFLDGDKFTSCISKMKFTSCEDDITTLNPILAGHPLDAYKIMSDNKGKMELKLPERVGYIITYDKVNDRVVECECFEDWKYDANTGNYAIKRKLGEYETVFGVDFNPYRRNGFEVYGIKTIKRWTDSLCQVCVLCDSRVKTDVYALVKDFVSHPLCLTVRDMCTIFKEDVPLYIDLIPVSGVAIDCERSEITLRTSKTAQMGITTLNFRNMLHSFSGYTVVYDGKRLHLDTISEMGMLLSSRTDTACDPKFKMTFKVDQTAGVSVSSVRIVETLNPMGLFLREISAEVCSDGLIILNTNRDYSNAELTDEDTKSVQMIADDIGFKEFSLFGTLSQIEQSYREVVGEGFKTEIKLGIMRTVGFR